MPTTDDPEQVRRVLFALVTATAGTAIGDRLCKRLRDVALEAMREEAAVSGGAAIAAGPWCDTRAAFGGVARAFHSASAQLHKAPDVATIAAAFERAADHFELLAEIPLMAANQP